MGQIRRKLFKNFEEIGAFSTVYRAKLIDPKLIDSNSDTESVELNILKANDEALSKSYLKETKVLEFADSGTLRNYLKANQNFSWFDKLHLSHQLADAIKYMYSADVAHRDLLRCAFVGKSSLHPPYERHYMNALCLHILRSGREAPIEGTPSQYFALFTENVLELIKLRVNSGPDVSFEEFLVDKVIKMIDKFAKKGSEPQLDQYQHEAVEILSFNAKIISILRICNDIVSSKLIPLTNIKEIIKSGQDSDEQSKKFVDHVLSILFKLEKKRAKPIFAKNIYNEVS
ncbi:e3 ubiquitin-protein ligase [Gigaspora margarita]|uniref:E3 ubiquitin-protein ligase n=1 Tax=Gigaspora margarita TaxID=4874 RepID=A0A8H4A9U2_GIGMA|nr:e3 ubiquitin-protein ligase [Gigaspora margarita]